MRRSRSRCFLFVLVAAFVATNNAAWAEQTNAPAPENPSKVTVQTFASGLQHPWGLQFLPGGRLIVTERPGRLRIVSKEGKLSPAIKGLPAISAVGQGGLLDVALAPDYPASGLVYFSYSEPRDGRKDGTSVARAKLVLEGDGGRLENVNVIFRQQPAYSSAMHYGSRLVFAPDGKLFITLGERGDKDQAQKPSHHLGKVVRINPDGSVPADNPKLPGWAPEVWSIGHRNVQGAALDPATGRLWTVEHGARGGDELNHPEAGKNYGWPVITWGIDYSGAKIGIGTAKDGLEQPVYYWKPSIATSGLAIYSGDLFPDWKGNIFVGGLGGAHLARLVLDGANVIGAEKLLAGLQQRIRDVRTGPDGELWVLTDDSNGKVLRLTPGP